ncbi:putative inactive peptidyl-prolyl cis-trans isomerase-like 6 [Gaertneriomyces sp. JEL0708]|nr:putative inactive peptidyl-prolyl cis-trans isomerase-like 6 [Gaertneriomyces sp. JEL0708]
MPVAQQPVITLTGHVRSPTFHKLSYLIRQLQTQRRFSTSVVPLLEFDWIEYRRKLCDRSPKVPRECVVDLNGQLLDEKAFIDFCNGHNIISDQEVTEIYVENEWKGMLNAFKNPIVYIDITYTNSSLGRLYVELFADTCPLSAAHFLSFVPRQSTNSAQELSYTNAQFTRIVPNGWVELLRPRKEDMKEDDSPPYIADENFIHTHSRRGVLSFIPSSGPHTNFFSFLITLDEVSALDKRSVVFGRVLQGDAVLRKMEKESSGERWREPMRIGACGIWETQ